MKASDYVILDHADKELLLRQVQQYRQKGWRPIGGRITRPSFTEKLYDHISGRDTIVTVPAHHYFAMRRD